MDYSDRSNPTVYLILLPKTWSDGRDDPLLIRTPPPSIAPFETDLAFPITTPVYDGDARPALSRDLPRTPSLPHLSLKASYPAVTVG
jgi:hypothetical protein